ncbi:MAG: UvrD-helicase domain-containing protein [Bacilli bacterium]|jgi:DNA helicase-2/ATP-dependent DNA helicase PcrA|nr:3'-5' exonuclease [Bacilli bacterium]
MYEKLKKILNKNQLLAVTTKAQYVRVVAGAGSGKTRVLTYRLAYLINELGVYPENILAFAFTNKAANEMKERAQVLLPKEKHYLRLSTFHSFCARFLRSEIGVLNYPTSFTIFDEEDQKVLIKNIAVELGYRKRDEIVTFAYSFINFYKTEGIYPEDVILEKDAPKDRIESLKFFHLYEQRKGEQKALDFDDLLLKTNYILESYPRIRTKWQNRFKHILVDEFQDTNDVQYRFLKLLMNPETSLYVVGDPDQTIYTWRGANPDIILKFDNEFLNSETIILNRNYRSTEIILTAANTLINHNRDRVHKDLYTENNLGEQIIYKQFNNRRNEAKWLVEEINKLEKNKIDFKYSDIVVLYRSSYITLDFEKELQRKKLPFKIFGGVKFFQRREIKDLIAYFRLLYNSYDDIAFERVINIPRRNVGEVALSNLKEEAYARELSIYNYLKLMQVKETKLKPKVAFKLKELIKLLEDTKAELNKSPKQFFDILNRFVVSLGYYEYLSLDEDKDDRIDNVKTLFEDLADFELRNPDSPFEEYLEYASLASFQDDVSDGNYISLMTIHVAKGLEFKYVFVVGLNESIFPHHRALEENGYKALEEERRLCYVAFTRAKEKLYLSCNRGFSFIADGFLIPSRFFKEAGFKLEGYRPSTNFYLGDENDGYFEDYVIKDYAEQVNIKKENDVEEWFKGDLVYHETFGNGVVTEVIDKDIIQIEFVDHGVKSMLGKHFMLSKRMKGHEA